MQRKDRFEAKAFHSNPAGVEDANLNQKLLLDYRVQGTRKAGEATISFSSESTLSFCLQYPKNVQYFMQNNNPFKLQRMDFTLNPNGCRMTTTMTMRGKAFCKEEKVAWGILQESSSATY